MNPLLQPLSQPPTGRIHLLQVLGNAIVGGMETYVIRLVERLPRERFAISALCPFESPLTARLRALQVNVLIAPMPSNDLSWGSVQMACALIHSAGVDVLHAHLPNGHLLAGVAGRLANRPVITTIHGRQLTPLDVEVHRSTGTHVSVVCQPTYFHALGMGVDAARLSCIPNGIDTEVFRPDIRASGPLHAELGLAEEVPLIAFVGRLSVEKGPELFLSATCLLRTLVPQAHFVVVGDGPMHGQMVDFIRRCNLDDCVHLLRLRDDMPAVYHSVDVLVSSSHSEAMPLAVMEAMASGVPVVATGVGGVPDLIEQGETGWMVEPGDVEGLAQRVAWVLRSPGERERMGRLARSRAVERMCLDKCVSDTASLLMQLACASAPASPAARRPANGAIRPLPNNRARDDSN